MQIRQEYNQGENLMKLLRDAIGLLALSGAVFYFANRPEYPHSEISYLLAAMIVIAGLYLLFNFAKKLLTYRYLRFISELPSISKEEFLAPTLKEIEKILEERSAYYEKHRERSESLHWQHVRATEKLDELLDAWDYVVGNPDDQKQIKI